VTMDQFFFTHPIYSKLVGPSVPIIDNSQQENENVCVRMYSPLMGHFNLSTPISYNNSISSESSSFLRFVPFHTSYINDQWTLPYSTMSYEG
jgi:hypothetical protein